ncbi:MAG: sulfotransferase [Geminicoccaceae bacterium]
MSTQTFSDVSPVFVVGAPRSGTTMVQRMLDAHPRLAIFDEVTYFEGILKMTGVVPDLAVPGAIDRFFEALPRLEQYPYWNNIDDLLVAVRAALEASDQPSYPLVYRTFMEAYARRCGKARFGDKSPANVRHLDATLAMFPKARIIHVVRDPRGAVASRRNTEWSSDEVLSTAAKWRLDVEAARRFAASAPAGVITEVRYEDMVRSTEKELRRLCDFVGEPYDPAMLEFHRSSDVSFQASPWKDGVFRPVSEASLERWRKELTEPQVGIIQLVVGKALRQHGYETATLSLATRLGLPLQLVREVRGWRAFKKEVAQRRRAADNPIGSDAKPLSRMALRFVSEQLGLRQR